MDMNMDGKTVIVAGLGVSGQSMMEVLGSRAGRVLGVDEKKPDADLHSFDQIDWDNTDMVMTSPVFNPRTPFILEAQKRNIPVMSEVELAWQLRVNSNTTGKPAQWIGITGTNARPSIAPTFGVENMLGTNPLTFGMPTDEAFPFVLDCATSIVQRGKIEYYARIGKDTPAGQVIGRNGEALTDSVEILDDLNAGKAALAPLGGIGEDLAGYKGYGYATVVEILSAALQQGNFLRALSGIGPNKEKIPFHLGHFFIAIDTEAFMGLDAFKKTAGDILRDLRNSTKAPDAERIYTAGEKEYLVWQKRKDSGVPINDAVQKELIAVRDELGLTQYKFPFED